MFSQFSALSQCAPHGSGNNLGRRFILKDYATQAERDAAFDMMTSVIVNGSTYAIIKHATNPTKLVTDPAEPDGTFDDIFTGDITINLVGGGTKICSFAANVLPVELVDFNVRSLSEGAQISWSTAQEFDNDKFIIERSIDGINFKAIGETKGSDNSNQIVHYSFLDNEVSNGKYYYQIKQVDYSGEYALSEIVVVQFKGMNDVNIFPNFVEQGEIIFVTSDAVLEFSIYSLDSKILFSANTNNVNEINTNTFKSGIYFIQFSNGLSKKFIIK